MWLGMVRLSGGYMLFGMVLCGFDRMYTNSVMVLCGFDHMYTKRSVMIRRWFARMYTKSVMIRCGLGRR